MSTATIPNIFVANTIIQSASMNANFSYLIGVLNTNILPAVGTINSVVTTDGSGNMQASTYASIVAGGVPLTTKGDLLTYSTTTTREPVGTDGQVLLADSSQTTGLRWGTNGGAFPQQAYNLGLAVSASGGALTVALKQEDGTTDPSSSNPVMLGMRSPSATSGAWNVRNISAALSQTVSLQTTLGMLASQLNNLWVYAIDSDGLGTVKLGLSTIKLNDGVLRSTVAESHTSTITIASPGVVTETGHGRSLNDKIQFTTTGALPTGLSVATDYYLVSVTTNTYQLALLPGGASIVTSGTQSGIHTTHTAWVNLVSDAVYANVAARLIGQIKFTLSTVGTWIAPSNVAVLGQFEDRESIIEYRKAAGNYGYTTTNRLVWDTLIVSSHGFTVSNALGTNIVIPKKGIYNIIYTSSGANSVLSNVNIAVNGTNIVTRVGSYDSAVSSSNSFSLACNLNDLITLNADTNTTIDAPTQIAITYQGPTA